jgi:hypothetical protein
MKNLLAVISAVIVLSFISSVFIYHKISRPGHYFKIGTHKTSDVFLRATPEYEYQVTMEADSVIISSFGETVAVLPYDSQLGQILLQDNE